MKRLVGSVLALTLLTVGCGAPRNCLVIPLQVELVKERREAALQQLESRARQVDRLNSNIRQAETRIADLQREHALLDSLYGGSAPE
jgi:hypothetical protein